MTDRILNVDQVAEMLNLSPNTIRWMRYDGSGPKSFKVGRRLAYRESDVVAYIEQQIAKEDERLAQIRESRNV